MKEVDAFLSQLKDAMELMSYIGIKLLKKK